MMVKASSTAGDSKVSDSTNNPHFVPGTQTIGRAKSSGRQTEMKPYLRAFALTAPMLFASATTEPVLAQKPGGILRMYSPDSPASMSILEEATSLLKGR